MSIIYIACALFGIGLIIFLHECGHFFAAKKVGVRVERFALGFDPTIRGRHLRFFSFKRGETEYVLGMIPFGGYVKMAGEFISGPDDPPPRNDELLSKSVGARALVFVAGAVMNIVSAFIFFIIAFAIGTPFPAPTIGVPQLGSEAWSKGLRSGDEVTAIDGEEILDFYELVLGIALGSGGEELELTVSRPSSPDGSGEREERTVRVTPQWNAAIGMYQIGVEPAIRPVLAGPPVPDSPAARAGLRQGDRIVGASVRGVPLPALSGSQLVGSLMDFQQMNGPGAIALVIEREGEEAPIEVELQMGVDEDAEPSRLLGVAGSGGGTWVRALRPGGGAEGEDDAEAVLEVGDRLLSIDEAPVETLYWVELLRRPLGESVRLEVQTHRGVRRTIDVDRDTFLGWIIRDDVRWSSRDARIQSLSDDSPLAAAGARAGDLIVRLGDEEIWDDVGALAELEKAREAPGRLVVLRAGAEVTLEWPGTTESLGVTWNSFPEIAAVLRGGPADRAGLRPGDRITELASGELTFPVRSFLDLTAAIQKIDLGAMVRVSWVSPSGETRTAETKLAQQSTEALGIAPLQHEQIVVRAGLGGAFQLGIQRTINIAKQVFLTLRSLLRQEVSARNLSGPVGITHVFTRAAEDGLVRLIYLMAMVSVNLGLLNLLPFPILDGGHLLFLLIEKIKGSPVSPKVQELATSVAFFLIIALFIFVTVHDVRRVLPF